MAKSGGNSEILIPQDGKSSIPPDGKPSPKANIGVQEIDKNHKRVGGSKKSVMDRLEFASKENDDVADFTASGGSDDA